MSKFKVGDRVRDAMFTNRPIGTVVFVRGDQIKVIWDDEPSDISWSLDDCDFELVQPSPSPSPVITKTVKEIVSGIYGKVRVEFPDNRSVGIYIHAECGASELTDIINTLTPIRDALADALEA